LNPTAWPTGGGKSKIILTCGRFPINQPVLQIVPNKGGDKITGIGWT
jgi:hypothetical protein